MAVNANSEQARRRARFWRRFWAVWIDAVVIYAVAVFAVSVAGALGIRLSLEPTAMVLAAVYGAALLAASGQTVGKRLLRIAVRTVDGTALGWRRATLREVGGKWMIAVAAPIAVGRAIIGADWIPTVMDVIVVLAVLLVLLVHYLITRRAWYDALAGTVVVALEPHERRPAKPAAATLAAAVLLAVSTQAVGFAVQGHIPCKLAVYRSMRPIGAHARFLQQQHTPPVHYIMGLFDRYDVVILCERYHPEASQWEFIFELVSDPGFVKRVGHVFTEYGQRDEQPYLDSLMATPGLGEEEVHQRVLHILRNMNLWPVWTNTNFYTYLMRLYRLNESLPKDRRIHHYLCDEALHWDQITSKQEYWRWYRSRPDRDQVMAERVIDTFRQIQASADECRQKCLVIMNYRHAWPVSLSGEPGSRKENVAQYLSEAFPGRTASVLLNTDIPFLFAGIRGGVWDAAFEAVGNRPLGFDLAGSPFGQDPFDQYPDWLFLRPWMKGAYSYADVFTGFVFDRPLRKQYLEQGIPGYYDGFRDEALRRAELRGDQYYLTFLGTIAAHDVRRSIAAHETGMVPVRNPNSYQIVQTLIEAAIGGLLGIGLLVALLSRPRDHLPATVTGGQ